MKRKLHYILGTELVNLPALKGCRVLSGEESLNNCILSANIMEVPDIQNWAQEGDLLVTTGYPFKDSPERLIKTARLLAEKGVAALAVKPKRFIDRIPEELIRLAQETKLLLIELGEDAVFSNIMYETVQAISYKGISDFLAAQKQVDHILSELNIEDSQEKMLETVEKELGRSLLLEDSENRIWCSSKTLEKEYYKLFKTFPTAMGGEVRLYTDIREMPVTAGQERVLDSIFPILQFQMKNNNLKQEKIREYKNRFLINLLQGTIVDTMEILLFAEEYGIHLKQDKKYLVGVFHYDRQEKELELARVKYHFRSWSSKYIMVLINGVFAIILQEDDSVDVELEELLREMQEALGQQVYVALSNPTPLNLLSVAYREADRIAQVSCKCHIDKRIVRHSDLGIFSLLAMIPNQADAMGYAEGMLEELYQYDAENGTSLMDTLEKYLENGCNAKLTARQLFIHYNTMLYRLEKIQQILGMDMENADNRLQLQIALKLYNMRSVVKEEAYGQK